MPIRNSVRSASGDRRRYNAVACAGFVMAQSLQWAADLRACDRQCVLDDTGGAIAELVLHYDPAMQTALAPLYTDFFNALGDSLRVLVLCPSDEAVNEFTRHWGRVAKAKAWALHVLNVDREITVWARDRAIAREDPCTGRISDVWLPSGVAYAEACRLNELDIAHDLFRHGLFPRPQHGKLWIEGGNVVANGRHAFIGAGVYANNLGNGWSAEGIDAELTRAFGRRVLVLGDDEGPGVPWDHIDMFVTPVSQTEVLVASPRLGNHLMQSHIRRPGYSGDLMPYEHTMYTSSQIDAQYDVVARQLRAQGYSVFRVPVLVDTFDEWLLTYNNVIMEQVNGRRIVYMPVYKLPSFDDAARAIYASVGFEVRTIDVSRLFEMGGTLRCVANVARRAPLPLPPS